VITGVGLIIANGVGRDAAWEALRSGANGIGNTQRCDVNDLASQVSGEVPEFDLSTYLDKKESRRMDRFTHLAIMAAGEAIDHSGLDINSEAEQIGCMIGVGIGGMETLEREFKNLFDKGPDRVSPFLVPMFIPDMAAGQVSIRYGAKGPNFNTVSACASGADSIGTAAELIRRGDAVAMIAGGAEGAVTRMSITAFANMRALSRNNDPATASRPFDRERDGFVLGEGSGILILENQEHAERRGANIICEYRGYGQSADAFHITQPSEQGEGAARAMNIALTKAQISPSDVDYINAHGTSTPMNDKFETLSIKSVFGEQAYSVPISSTKSMVGHTLGAAGGIEAVVTALSIKDDIIHPTINLDNPDQDCDLDYVTNESRAISVNIAMTNSLGFGGHNSSLVFSKYLG
jgi:3-oxoacyl-[acyl-carrier-protein] synthase II